MKNNNIMFIGGFSGTSKTSGKPFFALSFAKRPEISNDNKIGFESCSIFVDNNTFNDFRKVTPLNFVDASIIYARGGYILVSYSI